MSIYDLIDEISTYRITTESGITEVKQELCKLCDDIADLSDIICQKGSQEELEFMRSKAFLRFQWIAHLSNIKDFEKVIYKKLLEIRDEILIPK